MAVSRMRNKKYAIYPLFMAELPKLPRLMGNLGRGIRRWRQILGRKWKMAVSRMHSKNTLYTLIYGGIAEIPASCRKSGSRNMMVTSDFRPEVEIWPTVACKVLSTCIIRVFYFWKIRTYFYVFYFIIRVSSNSGPLDEQKLDCQNNKTANISVKNFTV